LKKKPKVNYFVKLEVFSYLSMQNETCSTQGNMNFVSGILSQTR